MVVIRIDFTYIREEYSCNDHILLDYDLTYKECSEYLSRLLGICEDKICITNKQYLGTKLVWQDR